MGRRLLGLVVLLVGLSVASPALAAGPTAVATDSDGVVYAGFASGGSIARYAGADGTPLTGWGTAGSNAGQLGGIVAIDVAPGSSGNVWILDTNRRVQEFTRSGTYIRGIQLGPCDSGITPDPNTRGGLDVSNTNVYVAHPCADQVLILRKSDLGTQATTSLTAPKGVSAQLYSTAPSGTNELYVAQPSQNRVVKLNPSYLSQDGSLTVSSPSDVFIDAFGVLTVSDRANNQIHLLDSNGNEFRTLGRPGSDLGSLNNPGAIDVFEQYSDLSGNIFIADTGNNRIQRWNPYGYTFWGAAATGGSSGGGGQQAPANSAKPTITGSAVEGQTVACQPGTWSNSPTNYSYQWTRNGSPIATGANYTLTSSDVGTQIVCVVTASNPAGSGQASSDPVTPTAAPRAPQNTVVPVISGLAQPGQTLSCSQGSWNGSPTGYAYAWRRDGSQIATGQTYVAQAADVGHAITCAVTATNAQGSTTAVSDPVTVTAVACTTGTTGVSINAGAIATNSRGVTLTIHEPAGATGVVISNDGGFAGATQQAITCDDKYTWTVPDSGVSERIPRTVYVRFVGSAIDGDKTFTDDIIIDTRPPAVAAATLTQTAAHAAKARLTTKATDAGTGVAKLQVASKKTARVFTTLKYAKFTRVASSVRWVRAIDRAGNVGKWVRIHVKR